jgi:hypothetical protein
MQSPGISEQEETAVLPKPLREFISGHLAATLSPGQQPLSDTDLGVR